MFIHSTGHYTQVKLICSKCCKENVWINREETPNDFVKLFSIIKDAGYRGHLSLVTLGPGDPFQKVPALLENVKNALSGI